MNCTHCNVWLDGARYTVEVRHKRADCVDEATLCSRCQRKLAQWLRNDVAYLSQAEARVLPYVTAGWRNDWIAQFLDYSPNTVKWNVQTLFHRAAAENRVQLLRWALRNGLSDASNLWLLARWGMHLFGEERNTS